MSDSGYPDNRMTMPGDGKHHTRVNARAAMPLKFDRGGLFPEFTTILEHRLVWLRPYLTYIHIAMAMVFGFVVLVPPFLPATPEGTGFIDIYVHTANFLMWGVWFPFVFLSVILAGRSWCGLLCPMGAASQWANKIGPKFEIPAWVQWPGTPVISFLVITIWAQTAGTRDHATATAIVFGSTLMAALLLGFFFGRNKRAWCRHMCPIGLLLGVYSRIGALDFVPKRPRSGGDRWTEKTACPTMIDLPHKTESRHCIVCVGCVSPRAKGGLFIRLRSPGAEIGAIRQHNPNFTEIMFLFMGTGAALGGFLWAILGSFQDMRQRLGNWAIDHNLFWIGDTGPRWLMSVYPEEREVFRWLDFISIVTYMVGWTLAITLALSLLTAIAAFISGRLGGDRNFRQRFVELGYQYLPLAMSSLLLGLGGKFFSGLAEYGVPHNVLTTIKIAAFAGSAVWSLHLANQLLRTQGLSPLRRILPIIPGFAGAALLAAAWYPAIF